MVSLPRVKLLVKVTTEVISGKRPMGEYAAAIYVLYRSPSIMMIYRSTLPGMCLTLDKRECEEFEMDLQHNQNCMLIRN